MRGMIAPLSPHEEVSLRRIALGFGDQVPEQHAARLKKLALIDGTPTGWTLTVLGQNWYQALGRPLNKQGDAQPDEVAQLLKAFIAPGAPER